MSRCVVRKEGLTGRLRAIMEGADSRSTEIGSRLLRLRWRCAGDGEGRIGSE
jgi:hypothetical protein